jgi:hypothetical protein
MFRKMFFLSVLFSCLVLSACGGKPAVDVVSSEAAATKISTPTIDPCSPQYVQILAKRVHNHMREFDDASTLASALTEDQLPAAVSELQRIRRIAQDEPVPSCLSPLKDLQINHMNTVIDTLLAMLNGAKPEDLQAGISDARKLHDDYALELAKVLGVTVVANPTTTP